MKRSLRGLFASAVLGVAVLASSPSAALAQADYLDRLPPLVDRDVFFGDPQIAYAALSPDGRFVSFVKQLDGILNVWVKRIDESFSAARPVTEDKTRPVIGYFWSQDGKYIFYTQDKLGDENFRVYAVDPTAAPAEGSAAPPARDLTPYEKVQARIISVPENAPNQMLVGLNDRDLQLHDVYRLDIVTGERTLVFQNDENIAGWLADLDGNLRLGVRVNEEGGTEILRVDGGELTAVYECSFEEECNPFRFHKDGRRVYMTTNKGDLDLTRLVLFDPQTGNEELVEGDPENQVDFGGAIFSRATDELIGTSYTGDRVRLYPKDPQFKKDIDVLRAAGLNGDLYFREPTRDDQVWIVKNIIDTDEGPNYLYNRSTGKVELLYRPRDDIPAQYMAEMKPVRYKARDGVEIPAYLTLPKGVEPRGLRAVIVPHGGPWARDGWGYNPMAQFLANRGYAVLQPNFRGSTGYGKRFLNLGNNEWGTGYMQHDITDGAKWLVEQGIAAADMIAIMGGSYGGYATLAGVAFTPDVYAAGVSIVGPSSIITLMESIPPYWKPIVKMFHKRVGNPGDSQDRQRLMAQSPLNSAEEIKAPLLVIQGANDPRVKKAESDQIVMAMQRLGRTVEYLVAPDEGHGFAGEINTLAMYAKIEEFLAQHLGGRYQETMSPEVRERLEELTVNVETLTLRE
ncbi:MAG: S9 family peptidase [Gemmatimonadota bacterium]|nr:MAG: S9 family peptidase [Gemmatimonadota bacterium]